MNFAPCSYKKHNLLVVSLIFTLAFFLVAGTAYAQFNFAPSNLLNVSINNPTSLQFGPDRRLYIAEQYGIIKIFTVIRNGSNSYSVTATETIDLINLIPNHNDNGTLNTEVSTRQITGILVKGTASNPIIYVSSSDSRWGGGPTVGDPNLDTNSGIVSMLSWNGSAWVKMDLVRGLPRSEEVHANNGLQLDVQNNILFVAVGGITNAGAPSTNFGFTCEFALSAAILSINLTVINALPINGSGNAAYKYDLPTVDDPTRANNPNGTDQNDPFGGNDGLNQAKIVTGGPVQIYATGLRNPYDLVITQGRKMYTVDNGPNQGWGGYPQNEGNANVTNEYVSGEPGSTTATPTEGVINNLDKLFYIGNIDTYVPGSFYGGHPNPIRANPAGAGLYTNDGTTGVWRNSKNSPNPLPADWPPVPDANPIEGDFLMPGVNGPALLTFNTSTNGIAEYTASNFNNALKGTLLACGFNSNIYKISLTADGTNVTNFKSAINKLDQDLPFASGLGSTPLDVTTQGDNDIFPGSVWVAMYGSDNITIYEPQDFVNCTGSYNSSDDDGDNYTNGDEVDNGTNPCSAASVPPDADHDLVSDLNDTDDDNDGISDKMDAFAIDSQNGLVTDLPVLYELFNNDPGTGFFGLGFTGLMTNKTSDYRNLFDAQSIIAGGAVGAFTIPSVSQGDALGNLNSQENGFQFGIRSVREAGPFTISTGMLGPFFNNNPQNNQSQGIYIGTGDQDNYLKIALNANNGIGGIEVVSENAGTPTSYQFQLSGGIPGSFLELFLSVDPASGKVQPKYASNGGTIINLGTPIQLSGALLNLLQGNLVYGVGIIATSRGATPFAATWDKINIIYDPTTATGTWTTIAPTTGIATAREENSYVQAGNKFYLLGGRGIKPVQEYDPINKSWTDKANTPIEINHFQAVTMNGLIYVAGAFTGGFPHETPVPTVYIFNPVTNQWLNSSTIPVDRRRGSAGAVVYNNKIYLVGGITDGHWSGWVNWFDEYDPATNTWTTLPNTPRARDHFNAEIINDKLYVIGGRRSSGITDQVFSLMIPEVDVYNFTTGQWSTLPAGSNLPSPRAGAASASIGNEVIIIGGEASQSFAYKQTDALDITTNTWRRLADLQQGRHGTHAIVNNRGIYVVAGAGTQGGSNLLNSQEVFNFFSPTTPGGSQILQTQVTAPRSLNFGSVLINRDSTKQFTITNSGGNQDILITSMAITGHASFTSNVPFTLPFIIPVGKSIVVNVKFKAVSVGAQAAILAITHSGQGTTTNITLNGEGVTPVYRINAGGPEITNSIGTFNADAFFTPDPGLKYTSTSSIAGTNDDAIYQTERSAGTDNGTFSYGFPVSNGKYVVVLHFAEIYFSGLNKRVFDVSMEGTKVLDNYDIIKKTGDFKATSETFTVNVSDGTLSIDFSALLSDGGIDRPKISAIEILSATPPPPVYYRDADSDGFGNAGLISTATTQPAGYVIDKTDCNDNDPTIYPGAPELCDSKDNNCSGQIDEICNLTPAYRINAGGVEVTNSIGTFNADAYFTPAPGQKYSNTAAIAATTDDAMYQSERSSTTENGILSYGFPVSNGQYIVVLHFAEIFYTSQNKRVFDVSLEEIKVLDNYDIVKKVGAFTATTESFSVNVSDGILNIDFSALVTDGGINRPKISAIEILAAAATTYYRDADVDGFGNAAVNTTATSPPAGYVIDNTDCNDNDPTIYPGAPELCDNKDNNCNGQIEEICNNTPVYRINAGGPQVTNSRGTFNADAYFTPAPGQTYSRTSAIAATADDAMYQTERGSSTDNGNFGYGFPVSNGQYIVVLHFAEIFFTGQNSRVFDVSIEGTKVLDNYDIVKKAGAFTATTETFTVNVSDGTLNINFSALLSDGGINRPKVSAIEILSPASTTTTYYRDADSDGYGNASVTTTAASQPAGYVSNNTDCNDSDPAIYPGAPELCDNKDNNCNGTVDEGVIGNTYYRDLDNDGYGNITATINACITPQGYVSNSTDCNDSDGTIYPGAPELCDGKDNNCNGTVDEGVIGNTYYRDLDNDGYGNNSATITACITPQGYVSNNTDCNDGDGTIYPGAPELCDSKDNNCNGTVDEGVIGNTYYRDLDNDGYGNITATITACIAPQGYVSNSTDCNDSDGTIYPGAPELCDGKDNNCNGTVDEGVIGNTYYRDLDNDGYGNITATITACITPQGYVSNNTDCNDGDRTIYPGAPELCDGKDNNCNGQIDEICTLTPVYRINAGGLQLTNSRGTFNADAYFTPAPGHTYSRIVAIAATTDDAMYQTERGSTTNNGTFGYGFPVSNGQYIVVLHFAEIFFTSQSSRVFDVSIEGTKVLDNYDIVKKAGAFAATTETFTVNVSDGTLNINFSALLSDGGINRPKVSAIEILSPISTTTIYYRDADSDGYGNASVTTTAASQPAGYVSNKTDCNDNDPTIYPGAPELCDSKDNNCNGQIDEICILTPVYRINAGGLQLTNSRGTFNADAYFTPAPGHTYSRIAAIAATTDDAMYQTERGSSTDNGNFGYGFPVSNRQYIVVLHFAEIFFTSQSSRVFDVSIEGTKVLDNYDIVKKAGAFTATTETFTVNVSDGTLNINFSALLSDGGINRPKVSAIEILSPASTTTTYYRDADSDGYGNASVTTTAASQPAGYVSNNTDCNDSDPAIYPGAPELCDNKDNNCNGTVDEGVIRNTYYRDMDNDGYGNITATINACIAPQGYVSNNTDCNDGDGTIYPGAPELCDGKDNNCNGTVDEGVIGNTYYRDLDNDGYGNITATITACITPQGYVSNSIDCNDSDGTIYPGAPELCDGKDNNCNGTVDEGVIGNTYYRDLDNDGYGNNSATITACIAPQGYVSNSTDCNDSDGTIYPGAPELCDGKDNNCNGTVDDGVIGNTYYRDLDNDGYGNNSATIIACIAPQGYVSNSTDCNDGDGTIYPGAPELCDGKDNNCNGTVDDGVVINTYYQDLDSDGYGNSTTTIIACTIPQGYVSNSTDCNDGDGTIYPGAPELCDNKDNNCNGTVDEGVIGNTYYQDMDNDGYGSSSTTIIACIIPQGYVSNSTDCNDGDGTIYPGAPELCDGKDNNCNGTVDEGVIGNTYYQDMDNDGYGSSSATIIACIIPQGYVSNNTDCNDGDGTIYPGAPELCDNKDNNCNGTVDEGVIGNTYYQDMDNDGYGSSSATIIACIIPQGYVSNSTDCNDGDGTIYPGAPELCDNKDNNCNGTVDEGVIGNTYYRDLDNDGYGSSSATIIACTIPQGYVSNNTDCNDGDGTIYPGAPELCDNKDNNCNGTVDEGVIGNTYYQDIDNDGYGSSSATIIACIIPQGYVSNSTDCNDSDGTIYPGAPELCDNKDNNCNGTVDEGVIGNTYYQDMDNDGYGSSSATIIACIIPQGYVSNSTDCNDSDGTIYPGAPELCDNKDNNCNGTVDEGVIGNTYYQDMDNDGYGSSSATIIACITPQGYVTNSTDCNDSDGTIYPGAPELCDSKDNNCNGTVDENCATTPSLSINNVSVYESQENAVLTITLSQISTQTVYVNYRTLNETATSPIDYSSVNSTLSIPPNTLSINITIPIVIDNLQEPTETFTVTLSDPENATIGTSNGTVSILNGSGTVLVTKNSKDRTQHILMNGSEIQKLNIKVFPNPANSHFNVSVQSAVNKPISLKIIDVSGRVVQSVSKLAANSSIMIGTGYRPGVYILEAIQGADRVRTMLIKQPK